MSNPESAFDSRTVERRVVARFPGDLPVAVETLGMYGNCPWPGRTADVSEQGVGLTLSRRFEPGTPISVAILEVGDWPIQILAKVVRVVPAANGGWVLGCRLPNQFDPDEYQLLVAKLNLTLEPPKSSPGSTAERIDVRAIREKLRRLASAREKKKSEG